MPKLKNHSQLHIDIRNEIINLIDKGVFHRCEKLSSETKLANQFSTSRTTIRDALLSLEQDGVVIRRHGIGTFIAPYPIKLSNRIDELVTIPEMISGEGFKPKLAFHDIKEIIGPSDGHKNLGISDIEILYQSKRLYLADGHPAVYIIEYIQLNNNARLIDWSNFKGDMVNFIEDQVGVRIDHVYARIKSIIGSPEIAEILQVGPCFPLLFTSHKAYTVEGLPISYSIAYHNSKYIEYDVVRKRR